MLSLRYPMEANIVGDSRETLRALLPLLEQKTERSWRERVEKSVADSWKTLVARAMQPADPVNPQRVYRELTHPMPDGAIITSAIGSRANRSSLELQNLRCI